MILFLDAAASVAPYPCIFQISIGRVLVFVLEVHFIGSRKQNFSHFLTLSLGDVSDN